MRYDRLQQHDRPAARGAAQPSLAEKALLRLARLLAREAAREALNAAAEADRRQLAERVKEPEA